MNFYMKNFLNNKTIYRNNKGFSLVELIIVIAIMAILAGAIAPALIRYIEKARAARATDEARIILNAVEAGIASNEGNDADLQIDSLFVTSEGGTINCGVLTNWIIGKTQSGQAFEETDTNYANYVLSKEILANLQSESNSSYKFYNFNGSASRPIGMNCASFASQYNCPGLIIVYNSHGKVIYLEYYNYGCLVRYEAGEYSFMQDEDSFISTTRLQMP